MNRKFIIVVSAMLIIFFLGNNLSYGVNVENTKEIIVNIPERTLYLLESGEILKSYPVAVGKKRTPTPVGRYRVLNKIVDPYYVKGDIPGGSIYNPLGSRWLGFKIHYGIHGNSDPSSIGKYISGGCIRMHERDVQELYEKVPISTPVTVTYNLMKVEKDVDNINPVLVVYNDYYSKEEGLDTKVINKLKELNIYEKISTERVNKLLKLLSKEKVVFSKGWTFFVNGDYVTDDILIEKDKYFVNKKKIEKYFNIKILSLASEQKALLMNEKVLEKRIQQKQYIPIEEIQRVLGGVIKIGKEKQILDYKLNYMKLNDKLVKGEFSNLVENPIIPLFPLVNKLDLKIDLVDNTLEFKYGDNSIDYVMYNNNPYVSVQTLYDKLNITNEVFTLNNKLELYIDPIIVFNNTIYNGKLIDKKIYIPYELIKCASCFDIQQDETEEICQQQICKEEKEKVLKEVVGDTEQLKAENQNVKEVCKLKEIDTITIAGTEYVILDDIRQFMKIEMNEFNTQIYLSEKEISNKN
ncbi:L,D-transpeptidase [Caldisalinibacter kiritimatiensis]|uniref:Putative exported protein n=1 Tax=Caldisalinibacter kiritimatiensis TaxID=1304284 RepID=R1CMC5_9FIRM|nr:L,D-transpeptidase [Caldisalinibacter kiritimatiensis]EOC99855.1 Putative exported protein [Caldisalinibacter kiritimatiensis]